MKWDFQQFTPPPARGKFRESLWEDPNWSAEEKYNGDRRIAQFCENNVRFTGRRISVHDGLLVEKTDNLPHMNQAIPELVGTVLDGEIVHPAVGSRNRHVTSIMGSLPARALQLQQKEGWLRYAVFDILFFKGVDLRPQPLVHRQTMLAEALSIWNCENAFPARSVTVQRREFLHEIWEHGGEGVILKNNRAPYGQHLSWVKVKKEITEDVIILGYDAPKALSEKIGSDGVKTVTKYYAKGLIGAVRFGQYRNGKLVDVGACSGMTDAMRGMFSSAREAFIGQVIEIEANEREPSGKFQHPRFVRLRPDKNPAECVWR